MKFIETFKNRTVLGISCIVFAIIFCFVLSPVIANTSNKTITVIRAVSEIKSGDEITKDMVKEVNMTVANQPDNIISDLKSVIGKYAAMDMTNGDYVLENKISDTPYVENTYFAGLDGNMRAISVTLKSFALGVSGKLKSGDIVSVIAPDYMETGMTVIPPELQYMEVIASTTKSGTDVEDVTGEDEDNLPSSATLLADEKQSRILAELEKNGTIHLSLVYRGDRATAEKFLTAQKDLNTPNTENAEEKQEQTAPAESEALSSNEGE